jgi:regulator of replication initiation timing
VSTLTKVFVFLTAIFGIVLSCLFVAAAAQWDNWRQLAQTYQQQAQGEFTQRINLQATAAAELAMKSDALEEKSRLLAAAEQRIVQLTSDLARTQGELARARNDAQAFEAGRAKLQESLDVVTRQLDGTQKQNVTLLSQNTDLQTRNAKLNSRVLDLTARVTTLTDEARNLQEKLFAAEQQLADGGRGRGTAIEPTSPSGVRASQPLVKGPIRAEVVEVQGGYASINAGESSGVAPGMTFIVFRDNGKYVGDLVVDRVWPGQAAGKLASVQDAVQIGDDAIFGLSQ